MKGMGHFVIIFFLLISGLISRSNQQCWPNNTATATNGNTYKTCCWYTNTCCSSEFANTLFNNFTAFANNFTNAPSNCYAIMANTKCISCAPNSSQYLSGVNTNGQPINITVCTSWCDQLYTTCSSFFEDNPQLGITGGNGTEYCESMRNIPEFSGLQWTTQYPCFEPPSLQVDKSSNLTAYTILTSNCLPFPPDPLDVWEWFLVLFLPSCAVVCPILGAIAGFGYAYYLRKKRGLTSFEGSAGSQHDSEFFY